MRTKARRGRAPALDPAKIARAVRRVSRREVLSMRAVADALDVDVTTLYRHVGGVAALRQIGARLAAPSALGRSAATRYVQALAMDRGAGRLTALKALALGAADFEPDAGVGRF